MKRVLILLLTILISISLFLLFSDKGNTLLKPYLSNYFTKKSPKNITVKIEELKIDFSNTKITALINQENRLYLTGDFSLLKKTLDMDYTFSSKKVSLQVKGRAKGSFQKVEVSGYGEGLNSQLNYQFQLHEKKIKNLKAQIEKAQIEEILSLLKQPIYAKGKANIEIEVPSLENKESKGTAHIEMKNTLLDDSLINQQFKINIPPKSHISANIDVDFQGDNRKFGGTIEHDLGKLDFKDTQYQMRSKSLSSEYTLYIKELKNLQTLTDMSLNGSIELHGYASYKENILTLRGDSKSLGGNALYYLEENSFQLNLKAIELSKLLMLLGKEKYASGTITSDLYLRDLKNLRGKFTLHSSQTKTENQALNRDFNLTLKKPVFFMFSLKGTIKENLINMQSDFLSDLFNLNSHDINYNIKDSSLKAPYDLQIPNLAKLEPLWKEKLRGRMHLKGTIKKGKSLEFTGETNSLDGRLNFKLQDDKLNSKLNNVSLEKLMYMLQYSESVQAGINGQLNYNLKMQTGTFRSRLHKAHLLPNKMTKLIKKFQGSDLSQEEFKHTKFDADFFPHKIDLTLDAKSKNAHISLYETRLNKKEKTIKGKIKLILLGKEFIGTISGDSDDPDISINASESLKEEVRKAVIKEVQKHINPQDLKKIGIDEEKQEAIKNLFNNLFK